MIYSANVRRIVRFRYALIKPDIFGKRIYGWRCLSVNDFKNFMRTLPPNVLNVDARIHESQDYFASMQSKYNLVEAWDWIRMGLFPSADRAVRERADQSPNDYRITKNGIWIRRSDLIN